MSKVWTPTGLQQGPVNSVVGKGETIYNPGSGQASLVTRGTKGVDNQPSSVSPDDDNIILGNDVDWRTGNKFADQVAPHTQALEGINKIYSKIQNASDKSSSSKNTLKVQKRQFAEQEQQHQQALQDSADQQRYQHEITDYTKNMNKYKCGKDKPHYDDGKIISDWDLFRGYAPGIGASIAQGLWWKNNPIQYHNTYASNPYAASSLQGLASLRQNPYQAYDEANQQSRQAQYSLSQAGGSSGAQRYAGMLGLGLGRQNTWAQIQQQAQQQNNAYKSQYFNAALQQGQQDRSARMQANQHDWDDYIKAHGAKVKGIETAMANTINMFRQMEADRFKGEMADKTDAIYNKMVENDSKRIEADANKNIGSIFEYKQNNNPLFKSYDFLGNPDVTMPWNIRFRKDDWRTPYLNMQAAAKAQQNAKDRDYYNRIRSWQNGGYSK